MGFFDRMSGMVRPTAEERDRANDRMMDLATTPVGIVVMAGLLAALVVGAIIGGLQ